MTRRARSLQAGVATLLLFLAWYVADGWTPPPTPPPAGDSAPAAEVRRDSPRSDDERVEAAFRERRSGEWVELLGSVVATLPDDRDGSRHQRLILRLASGRTLLVAHNIDLAPRVPVRRGDALRLRGEYEWNERGGVVHWTHADPQGRRVGGWIEHAGRRYR